MDRKYNLSYYVRPKLIKSCTLSLRNSETKGYKNSKNLSVTTGCCGKPIVDGRSWCERKRRA